MHTDTRQADDDAPAPERPPFRIEEAIGAAAMALICVISFANVVVRYATNVSFAFTEEISVFLLVVLTFVGAALAFANRDHIRITVVVQRLGPLGRRLCDGLTLAAGTLMFGALVWFGAGLTWDEYVYGETSPALGWPTWIYTLWLPLLCVAVLGRLWGPVLAGLRRRGRAGDAP
ncbi:TRAP transporter small permease [Roseospira visakhapatnamensis]|uniref:TRAP transporter small permease protein n=1 Tax=Roseospira visakhapatnamensis TaxID=390880 RepID=A0A7W6RGM5_9PROT|nr:TRAP transporter small permease [Roseospira visakhapatnamensis]MBB4267493.1 TRAP-type C4-dicarboxylate transport system permease small subunit [Roseospira visakhapatnamensis]